MKNSATMNYLLRIFIIATTIFILVPDVHGRPSYEIIRRQKRVSDQRLAELETLLALSRMHGKLVTVPVAFGRVDPTRIGRKKRSSLENDLQNLRRILQEIIHDSVPVSEENDEMLTSSWQNKNRNSQAENLLI